MFHARPVVTQEDDNDSMGAGGQDRTTTLPHSDRKQCFTSLPPPRRVATSGRSSTATRSSAQPSSTSVSTSSSRTGAATSTNDGGKSGGGGAHRGGDDDGVVVSLCPSMDLMVLGGGGGGQQQQGSQQQSSWALHRTMSPNKLSSLLSSSGGGIGNDKSSSNSDADENRTNDESGDRDRPAPAVAGCWRDDGRMYAIVAPSTSISSSSSSSSLSVHLYAVEDMMKDWNNATALPALLLLSNADKEGTINKQNRKPLSVSTGLASAWSGVGAPHPTWEQSEEDLERIWNDENVSFPVHYPPSKYHATYVMEAATKQPTASIGIGGSLVNSGNLLGTGSADDTYVYHPHHEPNNEDGASRTVLPCAHPYTLLAVVTRTTTSSSSSALKSSPYRLTTYLHGRYPYVVDLPLLPHAFSQRTFDARDDAGATARLALSHTLSHVVVTLPASKGDDSDLVVSCRLPRTVTRDAAVAARVIALDHHLNQLSRAIPDLASSYASSLHPLNQKVDALVATLQRYGITGGSDGITHSFLSQCLTSHIMGTSSADVDSQLNSAVEQYFSSAQFNDQLFTRMEQSVTVALSGIESSLQQRVVAPCQAVVVQAGEVLGLELSSLDEDDDDNYQHRTRAARAVVEAAKRLFLDVERVLREVIATRFVVRDWMDWLRSTAATVKARGTATTSALQQQAVQRRATDELTRRILHRLSTGPSETRMGQGDRRHAKASRTDLILGLPLGVLLESLPDATEQVALSLKEWQMGPCEVARSRTQLRSLSLVGQRVLALTTRIGSGGASLPSSSPSSSAVKGCFDPHPLAGPSKEWIVTASQAVGSRIDSNCINLYAFSLLSAADDDDYEHDEDDTIEDSQNGVAWAARLELESREETGPCRIVDAMFYGDNGKCTLSSLDGGTGTERRQSLALLVEQPTSKSLELWLVNYDPCRFSPVALDNADSSPTSEISVTEGSPVAHTVAPLAKGHRLDDRVAALSKKKPILYARTRTVGSAADGSTTSVRLEVSGSRGMGAVVTSHPALKTAVIDLFDLEEDEEDDDELDGEDGDDGSGDDEMQTD